jgi:proteasome lid subunit RPN8/RPN11
MSPYPEALNFVRKIGPLPLFWGSETNSMDLIEKEGINDYYIIAQEKIPLPIQQGKPQTYEFKPTLFLVTKTVMGRAVTLPDEKLTDLWQNAQPSAFYSMPKMPWELVQKMDKFFREVHFKHKCEAILVLVYDPAFFNSADPTLGWRAIAPKQTNTAGSCDYDPSSVQAKKTEQEIILGTIHSHPEMSAFFSGTDHKDQDDWDGIHITQAWKGKGPTEYHIAMILGGEEWTLQEHQVFDLPPLPNVNLTEVEEWIENVEEKKVIVGNGYVHGGSSTGYNGPQATLSVPLPSQSFIPSSKVRGIKLPEGAPSPKNTVIIPEYPSGIMTQKTGTVKCRLCSAPLLSLSIANRRCNACAGWILFEDETVSDLAAFRIEKGHTYDIYLDVEKSPHPISIFKIDETFTQDQRSGIVSPKL